MILAIDVGNTTVTLGLMDGDRAQGFWRLTSGRHTADELGLWMLLLLNHAGCKLQDLQAVVMGSVVPGLTALFVEAAEKYLGRACHVVHSQMDVGVKVNIKRPHELGADRLIDAYAACKYYGCPVIVADFGTAITLDVVTEGPVYQGGIIAPGVVTGMDALSGSTSKLPKIDFSAPPQALGKDTAECIRSGVIRGTACMIDGMIDRFEAEMNCRFLVVATGGHAQTVGALSERIEHVDPHLTLKGLAAIEREFFS